MKEIYVGSIKERMIGTKCPKCGRTAEGGTSIDDKQTSPKPKAGDYAVCLYCGALNRYTDGLKLAPVDRTERRKLQRDPRMGELIAIIEKIAAAKRQTWQ